MQNRELNTCKQDIYSFLRFSLPTNTELLWFGIFFGYVIFVPGTRCSDSKNDIAWNKTYSFRCY